MTQSVQYRGKLGFEARHPEALSSSSASVVDTLEEYGHAVRQFRSRSPNLILLECDHYRIELRYLRHPIKPTRANSADADCTETRLRSALNVTLFPNHPDHCDAELSELLLAVVLRRLTEELEVATVDWLDTPVTLTRAAFLGAFSDASEVETPSEAAMPTPLDGSADGTATVPPEVLLTVSPVTAPTDAAADTSAVIAPQIAAPDASQSAADPKQRPQGRLRGRACFEPVDVTAAQLAEHCAAMLDSSELRATGRHAIEARNRARARTKAILQHPRAAHYDMARIGGLLAAVPPRMLSAVAHILHSPQLRGHLHIICGATALLALQSSAAIAF
ncbi:MULTISPECIES: hypothetical protein [unclassified Phaeobacter]|uniref:hypothetical protein n=1 Tax=unclassified Phaeobacter TaxID=2621772 RepID=UPI003A885977